MNICMVNTASGFLLTFACDFNVCSVDLKSEKKIHLLHPSPGCATFV